jgi:hypothetical protein
MPNKSVYIAVPRLPKQTSVTPKHMPTDQRDFTQGQSDISDTSSKKRVHENDVDEDTVNEGNYKKKKIDDKIEQLESFLWDILVDLRKLKKEVN